ncbi:hypothetical protein NLU13_9569 [Sarocladium strictum]|uniref:Aminoglycoside phosphotransferase domain-containing protein n=1 Tax=Sarocladium strictum TaxID=5046 RepID=A0AA39L4B3_SARSR|nr:hypothetical protein NLU13_9569 [Sarocladium strictum]
MVKTPEEVASLLLARHDLSLTSIRTIQSLWAGYGSICSIKARASTDEAASAIAQLVYGSGLKATKTTEIPLILKFISPPRSSSGDEGHLRKIFSYEVEQHFYGQLAPRLGETAKVAKVFESTEKNHVGLEGVMAMLLEDLRVSYDVAGGKREALQPRQVHSAIEWLANFHRISKDWFSRDDDHSRFVLPPLDEERRRKQGQGGDSVWLNGGYTYLATRRKEYASLEKDSSSEWSAAFCEPKSSLGCSIAEAVAKVLTPRGRLAESYIHGDVKSENMFTTEHGDKVAFFDFQYVGLGLGVCDLAKLFTCSIPIKMLGDDSEEVIPASEGEKDLLRRYRTALGMSANASEYPEEEFRRHWECALVDWCRFQASWGFWGNTEWLEGRVRSILQDDHWQSWLENELNKRG